MYTHSRKPPPRRTASTPPPRDSVSSARRRTSSLGIKIVFNLLWVESYQGMDENSNLNPRTNNCTDWCWLRRLPVLLVLLVAAAVAGGCATASGRCGQQQRERGRRRRVVIGDSDSSIQYTVCGCAKER